MLSVATGCDKNSKQICDILILFMNMYPEP